jgi:hypothetical protein
MRSFITCTLRQVITSRRMRGGGMYHACETNAYKIWSENLKGRDRSEDLDIDERIIFERILGT